MIWKALIALSIAIATFLFNLFPTASSTIVTNMTNTEHTIRDMITSLNFVMPVDVFFTVFGTMLICEVALFLWHASRWIITLVTGGIIKAK